MLADVLVADRSLARPARRVADEDDARLGQRLDPRGGVDEIARNHALSLGPDRHSGLAGENACADAESRSAELVGEPGDRRDEVESGPHGALRVVLVCDGRSPYGHHGVADELLDRPAVALDKPAARIEVARQKLPHLLGVALLRDRGESDEIGEEDGDDAPLCKRLDAERLHPVERRAAFVAEPLAWLRMRPAGRAPLAAERRAATATEPGLRAIRGSARTAGSRPHHRRLTRP